MTRADIEAKARQIAEVVEETKQNAQNAAALTGVAVVLLVGIAYLVGRRKRRAGKAVVEVYRI
ncbi:MAG TPA: LPXTG cell wall anchor domain-containing protein [Acidimicrobiia bacterium]